MWEVSSRQRGQPGRAFRCGPGAARRPEGEGVMGRVQEARSRGVEEMIMEAFGVIRSRQTGSHRRARVEEGRGQTSDTVLSGGYVGRDCRDQGWRPRQG